MPQNKFNWGLINDNISQTDKLAMIEFISQPNVRFTNGQRVKEFEKEWSAWLGVKHTAFVNSGASANYIMMSIVKEMRGLGEVIVPPIGWVSDISPAVNLGFTPVFVDVDKETLGMSFEKIKLATTENTKAIVLVHALGFNAISEELVNFTKERNILLIEDCCESHGAVYNDKLMFCEYRSCEIINMIHVKCSLNQALNDEGCKGFLFFTKESVKCHFSVKWQKKKARV